MNFEIKKTTKIFNDKIKIRSDKSCVFIKTKSNLFLNNCRCNKEKN